MPREVLSFSMHGMRFNYRVAAICIRDGHVLVCREDDDDYVMLPGGRVELGEDSFTALQREIAEEMKCRADVGRLVFSFESFYGREDEMFHEMGFIYETVLPEDFPFKSGAPALVTQDEGHDLYFTWVPLKPASLRAINLLPGWLCDRLCALPAEQAHVVVDTRKAAS